MSDVNIEVEAVSCAVCGSSDSEQAALSKDYEYETTDMEFRFVRCSCCGHVYLNPRPCMQCAHAIYPKNYYTVSGAKTAAVWILDGLKERVLYARVADLLASTPMGGCVLEVGSGDGALLSSIKSKRPDLSLTALDLQFSRDVKERMSAMDVTVLEMPIEQARLERKYDLIIMNQLIEHVWDVRGCIAKLSDALNPGGIISMSTPDLNGYDRRWFKDGAWGGYYTPRHLNIFSYSALERICGEYGLSVRYSRRLVAPMVWVRSFHNWLKIRRNPAAAFFVDGNLMLVALFTLIDKLAIVFGLRTSNQQLVFVNREHRGDS